jgi:hypothetical protein
MQGHRMTSDRTLQTNENRFGMSPDVSAGQEDCTPFSPSSPAATMAQPNWTPTMQQCLLTSNWTSQPDENGFGMSLDVPAGQEVCTQFFLLIKQCRVLSFQACQNPGQAIQHPSLTCRPICIHPRFLMSKPPYLALLSALAIPAHNHNATKPIVAKAS